MHAAYDGEYLEIDYQVIPKVYTFIMADAQEMQLKSALKLSAGGGYVDTEQFQLVQGKCPVVQDDLIANELPVEADMTLAVQRWVEPSVAGTSELNYGWQDGPSQWWYCKGGDPFGHPGTLMRTEPSEREGSCQEGIVAAYAGELVQVDAVVQTSTFTADQILKLPAASCAWMAVHAGWAMVERATATLGMKVNSSFYRRWVVLIRQRDSSVQLITCKLRSVAVLEYRHL